MANLVVVCVYDSAVAAFGRPAFVRSIGEALRLFQDEVNREPQASMPNHLQEHPKDFSLYRLGEFDEGNGRFVCPELPEKLADAMGVKIPKV